MSLFERAGISVIVPTYRDWQGLESCLKALGLQRTALDLYEVLVVNNDSREAAPDRLILPCNARMLVEAKPGSYAARNRGINEARGEVLAFLDADCTPEPGWLESAMTCLETQGADLVAGHITLTYRGTHLTPAECYEKAFAFRQAQNVEQGVAVTANLVVRREVVDAVGGFNEQMMSGGDFEWTRRATSAGFRLVHCPDAVVRHPARDSLASLAQKARRVSAGSMALHGETGALQGGGRVLNNLAHDLLELLLKRRDMTWRERAWALLVLVYLKGVKVAQRCRLMAPGAERRGLPR